MTTTANAKVECYKVEFFDALVALFDTSTGDAPNAQDMDVINGLVYQAFARPGVYEGSNYALSVDFIVRDPECGTCGGTDYTPQGACYGCCTGLVRPPRHGETAIETDPRNPAVVHFAGFEDHSLCGMPARDLDGTHHRIVSFYEGVATCTRCIAAAEAAIATPAPKTMADYAPGTAVKRMLVEASYLTPNANGIKLIQLAIEAESTEQCIETDAMERITWMAEYVHELRATSSHHC